jgi:hypothetical protein
MAGSTTTIIPESSHTNTEGITYRVAIDVARIQANVLACEGGRLSELTVRNWLRSVGFTPEPCADGQTWLADAEGLRRLDKSEILRVERVREYAPLVGRDAD